MGRTWEDLGKGKLLPVYNVWEYFVFLYVYCHMCESVHVGIKCIKSLELKLQIVMNYQPWVLGTWIL